MMYRTGLTDDQFSCNSTNSTFCTLHMPCADFTGFADGMSFQIKFEGHSDYILMPLGVFATDKLGKCQVHIAENPVKNSQIILGSMFLSQFKAYWQVVQHSVSNYNEQASFLNLAHHKATWVSYLGHEDLSSTATLSGYFNNLTDTTFNMPLKVNQTDYTISVTASLSF